MGKSPIVAKINALLAEKGIPKQQFYRDCNITSASFSLWNTGKTTPRLRSLQTIADYLGVPLSEIAKGASPSFNLSAPDDPAIKNEPAAHQGDELSAEFRAKYSKLPPEQQKLIEAMIDSLLSGKG